MTDPTPPAERVIEVAPQGEIPRTTEECLERLREIITDMSDGLEAYGDASDANRMDGTFYLSALESALTTMREERDRVQDALRGFVYGVINKCVDGRLTMNVSFEAFKRAEAIVYPAALKPVSDRQPEGETK